MILTVGNTKGGVGKSTIAIQLAIGRVLAGKRVLLVDGDRQQSSLDAITLRADTGLPMLAAVAYADGPTLRSQVLLQAANYDDVVIDAGGRDSTALRGALTISDKLLIPFRPRTFDVWALEGISALVEESRSVADLEAVAFVNCADPAGDENKDAAAALADYPSLRLLDVRVVSRKAFSNACGEGRHVEEMPRRDARACLEMDLLQTAIFGQ